MLPASKPVAPAGRLAAPPALAFSTPAATELFVFDKRTIGYVEPVAQVVDTGTGLVTITQIQPIRVNLQVSARDHFRPIMMTTMAALLGTLPIALGAGAGAELRQPLGLAVVGGLVVSQVVTLFITPVIYLGMEWVAGLFGASSSETVAPATPVVVPHPASGRH